MTAFATAGNVRAQIEPTHRAKHAGLGVGLFSGGEVHALFGFGALERTIDSVKHDIAKVQEARHHDHT